MGGSPIKVTKNCIKTKLCPEEPEDRSPLSMRESRVHYSGPEVYSTGARCVNPSN